MLKGCYRGVTIFYYILCTILVVLGYFSSKSLYIPGFSLCVVMYFPGITRDVTFVLHGCYRVVRGVLQRMLQGCKKGFCVIFHVWNVVACLIHLGASWTFKKGYAWLHFSSLKKQPKLWILSKGLFAPGPLGDPNKRYLYNKIKKNLADQ